jgi:hypothetical protein
MGQPIFAAAKARQGFGLYTISYDKSGEPIRFAAFIFKGLRRKNI